MVLRKVEIQYFKNSGKFYTEAMVEIEDGSKLSQSVALMSNISDKLREMKAKRCLPGLSEGCDWDTGIIYVNCENGYPVIILPSFMKEAVRIYQQIEEEKGNYEV